MKITHLTFLSLTSVAILAFQVILGNQAYSSQDISADEMLATIIKQHQLKGAPLLKLHPVDIRSPIAQLGKRLFFSTRLGGNHDSACVTCHHPALGGGDALSLPVGVDAEKPDLIGPGRRHSAKGFEFDGGPPVPRNAQTTFNTVFYSRCIFWDCRIESLGATPGMNGNDDSIIRTPDTTAGMPRIRAKSLLQAQAAFPVTSREEMRAKFKEHDDNNELRDILAHRLLTDSYDWEIDFRRAFNSNAESKEVITFQNITLAIAAYEASQVFINNPWKRYVEGDRRAISAKAKQGAIWFFQNGDQGGFACASCHNGDFFTDEQSHVVAIPQIGRGKKDGKNYDHDFGRLILTGNSEDQFAFRTPSLLNVEVTGPYGHSGAYRDLRDVIRHMTDPIAAIETFDFELKQLDPGIQKKHAKENTLEALSHLRNLKDSGKSKLVFKSIENAQVEAIYEFLLTLTDPCVKDTQCLSPWIQ